MQRKACSPWVVAVPSAAVVNSLEPHPLLPVHWGNNHAYNNFSDKEAMYIVVHVWMAFRKHSSILRYEVGLT